MKVHVDCELNTNSIDNSWVYLVFMHTTVHYQSNMTCLNGLVMNLCVF